MSIASYNRIQPNIWVTNMTIFIKKDIRPTLHKVTIHNHTLTLVYTLLTTTQLVTVKFLTSLKMPLASRLD